MRKKTTSLFLIGFLMVLTSALASYWEKPAEKPVIFPSPKQEPLSWNESPFGIFALGVADCDNDTEDPKVVVQNITIELNSNGNATITAANIDNGSSDNCTINSRTLSKTSFDCSSVGANTVRLTVMDVKGNSAYKEATVTVVDNVAPVAKAKNITVQLSSSGNATIAENAVDSGSSDACGGLTFDTNITSFDCSNVGENPVTLTVTDENGNTDTATATVTVEDSIDPTAVAKDITIQLDASGNATITANDIDNGSSDNCRIANLSLNKTTFNCGDVGDNSVTLTVTDENGNTSTATATVTVEDSIDPTAVAKDITIQLDASGNASITANDIDNGSSDNCEIDEILLSKTNFDCDDVGENQVTLTVTDVHDNSATKTAKVTVQDNINPTVKTQNITVELDANGQATISAEDIDNGSSDNCAIDEISLSKTSFDCDDVGENQVTLTVTDVHNNSTTKTATVTVEDNIDPEIPDLPDLTWSCGMEITDFPTTTDNCSGEITATTNSELEFESFGNYTITWIFTDPSGNEVSATQNVIVPEPTVDIPSINGSEFCNEEAIPKIEFTGNELENKGYEWSYKDGNGNNIDIGLPASGSGNIPEFNAENNGSEIIEAVFTVIPLGNGCKGEPVNFSIFIKPTPTITKPDDIVVCAGETVEQIKFPGASVSGTGKHWVNDNEAIGLAANGRGNIDAFTATNPTSESIFATISVTPKANGCEGIPETFTIEVKPKPEVTGFPEDQTYCNGEITEALNLSSNVTGTTFNITGGSAIGLSNKTGVSQIPSFTAKAGNATVSITPTSDGCTGEAVTYNVTVNPTPNVSVSPSSQQICSGETTSISLSGSAESFSWEVTEAGSNISGATNGSGNNIVQTLSNSGTQPQSVKYRITPEAKGCTGTPIMVTVTVNPIPELVINIPECQTSVDLTDPSIKHGSTSGLTYTYWTNAEATTQLQNPSEAGMGTYYIKGTSSAGCAVIEEVVIDKIKPVIINLSNAPSEICSNTVFNFSPESNVTGTTFSWSRPATNGISNPESSSTDENPNNPNEILNNTTTNPIEVTYIYTLTSPNGCTNEQKVKVEVQPTPMLVTQDYNHQICGGEKFSYTPISTLGATEFYWERRDQTGKILSSGNGAIEEILYNDTENNITYTYYYQLEDTNCKNDEEYRVPVTVLSSFKVDASASAIEICPGESVDLYSSSDFFQGAQGALIDENFNSSTNWTTNNAGSSTWSRRNDYNPPGPDNTVRNNGSYMVSNKYDLSENSSNREATLTSPTFSTVGYTSLELEFKLFYNDVGADWGDYAVIDYSLNNGGSWNVYGYINQDLGDETHFYTLSDLSLHDLIGHEEVKIRFRFVTQGNNARGYTWAIDDVKITGESQNVPEVEWTSNTNSNWTSDEPNPTNVFPTETTVYTVKYFDPEIECPGIATVTVTVREPLNPTITANYCGDSKFIELVSDNEYDSYIWESGGEVLGRNRRLDVEIASTYTLTVTDEFGCVGTGSINVSEELIVNGDFEDGVSGFYTEYRNKTNNGDLYPEGDFTVDRNARDYHNDFDGRDHTTGNGKFMIINGHPGSGKVIWRQTIEDIQPNTNYYFNAWGMNVNPKTPARLQFRVNGKATGTVADLRGVPVGQWVKFYSNPFWNSGDATSATLEIINLETIRDGNDFGLDDISFGTLEAIKFNIDPTNNSIICEGETLELYANIEGGREPIEFLWEGPNGFTSTEENPVIENATAEMAGAYTLTVSDFYGCAPQTATTEVKILKINSGEDQTVCSSAAEVTLEGLITGSEAGGTWSTSGSGTFSNKTQLDAIYTASENDIAAGSVSLTLTSNDPEATCTDEVLITFNTSPEATISVTPVTCYGAKDGTATASVSSGTGTAPFTYQWQDENGNVVGNTQTVSNLSPTQSGYTVTVTDTNGCLTEISSPAIPEPTALEIVGTSVADVTCFGGADGTATLEVTGGYIEGNDPNYTLALLDSDGNEVFSESNNSNGILLVENLKFGNYTFTANTSNGCSLLSENIAINQPEEIIVDAGADQSPEQCGITQVQLEAVPVDQSLGDGKWNVISGQGGYFEDAYLPNTIFYGEANTTYELEWAVIPKTDCPELFDAITVQFPESCSKLNFDGEDDYVDAGNNFTMAGKNFSVEAWVKPNAVSGVNTIISKRVEGEANLGYDLILNNGAPSFRVRNRSVTSTKKIGTDRWYHIAGVYSDSQMSLYVDGIEIQKNTNNIPGGSGNFEAPFLIGAAPSPASTTGTKEHFNGYIEEVRIWEGAISTEQIRFFMNQRLWKNGSKVDGEVLKQEMNITNAPSLPNYSNLLGYYQLLAREDLISSGYTENSGSEGSKANGLLKNIQQMQENTAPLPYILPTSGMDWYSKATWELPETGYQNITQRNVWDPPNSEGINKEKINWNIVKLNGKTIHNSGTANNANSIFLLGLIDEGGKLIMEGEPNHSGDALKITHYLKLDGIIDLNGESQLIQPEGSIAEGNGYIERDQQGTLSSYNYNYWSSPVIKNFNSDTYKVGEVLVEGFKFEGVFAFGNKKGKIAPVRFGDGPFFVEHTSDANHVLVSNYWINGFFPQGNEENANQYSAWKQLGSNPSDPAKFLKPGEGFTMKGSEDVEVVQAENSGFYQSYTFKGFPNNGDILLRTSYPNQNYLVGNPYPSAIDANKFIDENEPYINGAVYYWHHFAGKSHYLQDYIGGYAVYNKSLSLPAKSVDARINNSDPNRSGKKVPGRYVPVAQGFFVNTSKGGSNATNSNPQSGQIKFTNEMRLFVTEKSNRDSQFLIAIPETKPGKQVTYTEDNRYKIRLNLDSPQGYWRQIGVVADATTSEGFDYGYDAPILDKDKEDMFWMIDGEEYVIQAVPDFNPERVLPLGIKIAAEKEFRIEIDSLENMPDDINIYIRNNVDSTYHDLRKGAFTDSIPPGNYLERYALVFQEPVSEDIDEGEDPGDEDTDGEEDNDSGSEDDTGDDDTDGENDGGDPDEDGIPVDGEEGDSQENFYVYYSNEDKEITIENPDLTSIKWGRLSSLSGQEIQVYPNLPKEKVIKLPVKQNPVGVYVLKLQLENKVITLKFVKY